MVRAILAGLFIFFLPGFSIINAIFPVKGALDEEFDLLYRIAYGIGGSVALTIILGFALGWVPASSFGEGHFTADNLWIGLISMTLVFLFVGWYRGAYQWLKYIHPSLARPQRTKKEDEGYEKEGQDIKRLQQLKKEQISLKEDIKESEKKMKRAKKDEKKRLMEEKEKCKEELERVENKLKRLEEKIEKRF
ncbi:MAG: DUF1616 domain-containing protein [Candidatus Thermoplasmatota archaeon]